MTESQATPGEAAMGNDDKHEMRYPNGRSGGVQSTRKIGQKFALTATNGFEQARSANQNLWREIA